MGGATITNSYNGDATDSKGNITLNGKVQAVDAVSISATNGDITVDDVASSGSTVAIETTTGNITLDGTGSSKSGTTVKVLSEGDVNVTGALTTTGTGTDLGNVEVSTPKGSITLKGKQNEAGETLRLLTPRARHLLPLPIRVPTIPLTHSQNSGRHYHHRGCEGG